LSNIMAELASSTPTSKFCPSAKLGSYGYRVSVPNRFAFEVAS
jgi:hypothetical protein